MRNEYISDIVNRIDASKEFTVFFIGDSITEGAGATSPENTYVAVFTSEFAKHYPDRKIIRYDGKRQSAHGAELLPLLGYGEPIEVQNAANGVITVVRSGLGGNTVQRMLNRKDDFINYKIDGRTADLFIINVGINDALIRDPKKYVTYDVFGKNLNALIDEIEGSMPGTDIILVTPSYNDDGLTAQSHLDSYVDEMKRVAESRNIPVIDLHRAWMEHLVVGGETFGQGDWLIQGRGDRCHPCDKGHAEIAKFLIKNMFGEAKPIDTVTEK